ncbi:MAG: PAS domain-containing protein [Bacteroidota bacterium]
MTRRFPGSSFLGRFTARPAQLAAEVAAAQRPGEQFYHALSDSIHQGFCVIEVLYDEDGAPCDYRFLETNAAFEEQSGLVDPIGRTARSFVPDLEAHWIERYGRVADTGVTERHVGEVADMNRVFEIEAFRVCEPGSHRVGILFTDITERTRTEALLRENEERLRHAQDAAGIGTWDLDVATGVVSWSDGVFDLVGLPAEAGVPPAQVWERLVHPEDRERVHRAVQEALDAGGSYVNEFRVLRPDGTMRWLAARGHVARDAAGRPVRMLGVNFDITERKEAERALADLNGTLEARVEAQTEQVRTLARALTLAEQQERRRIAHVLHDDLQQLLVGAQLATATGSDAGRLGAILDEAIEKTRTLSHELSPPFLHNDRLDDLLDWLADHAREYYDLKVWVRVTPDLTLPGEGLRELLYQALRELLLNVVKHAETDGVLIAASRVGERVRVVVRDEGVGFDPGQRGESEATLGLPSLRERLALVGGHLNVVSVPGQGTLVTLDLPLGKVAA